MTNIRKLVALSLATAVAVAVSPCVQAQEDVFDKLLKDVGETEATSKKAETPAPVEKAEAAAPAEKAEAAAPAEKAEEAAPVEKAEEAAPAEKAEEAAPAEKAEEAAPAEKAEEPAPTEKAEEAAPAVAEKAPVAAPATISPSDAELIDNLKTTQKLRRQALDVQAMREITEARRCMENEEYDEAVRHYGLASKLISDRPTAKDLRKECDQGVAEGLYRAALQEDVLGRRERAVKLLEKAIDMRHPKARRLLERWNADGDPDANRVDVSALKHRRNDEDYKLDREQIRWHLKRSAQYLAVKDMKKALEECEIVLVNDPYNREAIRVRQAIQKKRKVILQKERVAARDGMIADVDEAWRPVYAVNAASLQESSSETVKAQTGEDPERTKEQEIERRMKEMILPTISFKPPATIIDAVEFFTTASKDYDHPDRPVNERGFNFVIKGKANAAAPAAAAEESNEGFGADEGGAEATSGTAPQIQTINANNISLYEALKLVCESVDYKFVIRGEIVMVMQKDESTSEMLSRKYNVVDAFLERMTSAAADLKDMKTAGWGTSSGKKEDDGEENQERDWKAFFEQMGIKWPEGSSIMHIKTLGKLYVRNTRENLAEFEKVLNEMGSQTKLIEIETRFVEVSQEDLNSLGFEWILNSDYSLNLGDKLGKALGVHGSEWGTESGSRTIETRRDGSGSMTQSSFGMQQDASTFDNLRQNGGDWSKLSTDRSIGESGSQNAQSSTITGSRSVSDTYSRSTPYVSRNGNLIRNHGGDRNLGLNAFGGTGSDYGNGNRYLSQTGNHISGSDASNNDQFMRVNAFLGSADLSMILHMLSQRSDTDLLSAPKVVTKSGENAVIKVVVEYIYPQDYDVQLQSSGSSSGGSSSGSSQSAILAVVEPQNFTMREVGVILDVLPTYTEANGGTIDLELKPQVVDEPIWHNYGMKIPFTGNASSSTAVPDFAGIINSMVGAVTTLGTSLSPDEKTVIAGRVVDTSMAAIDSLSTAGTQNMTWYDAPMEQPWFPVRSIDSKVSITPGSTVVMGGLIREERKAMDDKVPFLGDLPFVGRLFRSHAERTIKRNLLIFVTGRLITPSGRELTLNEETVEAPGEVKAAPKAE